MSWYIRRYVSTCDLCLRTKAHRHPLVREFHPLPILDNPWDTVSVDFIVELLDSEGYNAVMVVVDSVTKRAHFIPTFTTVTAAGTARLFIQHVWKHHGLPRKVVSNRGPQFHIGTLHCAEWFHSQNSHSVPKDLDSQGPLNPQMLYIEINKGRNCKLGYLLTG